MSAIRNFAFAALAAAALAGTVQAQTTATPANPPVAGRHAGRGERGMGGFRDLNLTDAQKSRIKAIHARYQPQLAAARERARPFMDSARAARQRGDTASARAEMQKARTAMQSGSATRTQEQNEIRGILTPDQQAKFDAGRQKRQERAGKRGQHRGRGASRRGRRTASGA